MRTGKSTAGGSEKSLRGHAESALRHLKQNEAGEWEPDRNAGPWFRDLIRAVCANGGTGFNPALALALVTALKDMRDGRRVYTSTGHIAKGFLLGTIAAWTSLSEAPRTAMGQSGI